jgi:cytochrome c-type biogenesis protein CcmH/NrfG
VDYDGWPIARAVTEWMPQGVVVLLLLGATLWVFHRRPWVGFLGAWCFLILAPTSSVLPIVTEVAAERRMYLPLGALMLLAVVGIRTLLRRLVPHAAPQRAVAIALVVLVGGTLSAATVRRHRDYRTERAMLEDILAKRPNNARAHYNLGIVLAEQGGFAEATAHFLEALRIVPDYAEARYNVGVALARQGRHQEATAQYAEALRLRPDLLAVYARPSRTGTGGRTDTHAVDSDHAVR